ncbi:prepilin-type N-terminal cleavage/methylation domain-containing protein [Pseudoalteromonas sp. SSM20]|uniref:prepilin-type N-terminal cleavage/methylation domain-containing protein n=1 Tax=Pseudoalteromonas sp. SSM20 TaxID=3139394 RepID=UPI003BACB3EE
MNYRGFTLIELIIVIVILGVIAVTALPKFLAISSDARASFIDQLETSVKTANQMVNGKLHIKNVVKQQHNSLSQVIDIALDGNGSLETRLIWHYLDNTYIHKWLDASSDTIFELEGITHAYVGYDFDNDGRVKDDNCYFLYVQAQSVVLGPSYEKMLTGC